MRNFFLKTTLMVSFLTLCALFLQGQKFEYADGWGKQGLTIEQQKSDGITFNYSIKEFVLTDQQIKGEVLKVVQLPGNMLPNDAGMPNLPGESKMVAIPLGAKPKLKVTDFKVETIENVAIAPAPVIPLDTDEKPMVYEKDEKVYSADRFYPADPFKISESIKIRGVNAVTLGITPFQYNPVTKVLKIYRDIKLEIAFEGGNGKLSDAKYRSRYWESILQQNIINYNALPKIDFAQQNTPSKDGEADYVILTIDNPDFIAKANEIAEFRRKQGISSMVITTTDVGGNTVTAIEDWVDNAYNTWTNPPEAFLLLGDYSTGSNGIISHLYEHPASGWGYPDFASDNRYADVDGDELPDIVFARITAENTDQLNTMVSKFMDYEQNPPTDAGFYDNPITALGWQTERWFQICSEVVGGFWNNELGKNTVRINAVYEGSPASDPWSTATNTETVMNYFGPNGLNYLPETPGELGGWTGGTAGDVANAINNGAFMLQHRDHGAYYGWGEPAFQTDNISSLTNVDNKLPFIFSINCQTGAFHNPDTDPTFTEAFHRYTYNGQNSGALGLIAATEVSYSFVNDVYVWGLYDNMWPNFMPDETAEFPAGFVYPAFGNTAGKYFLEQSSWPYNTDNKQVTHRLFHHHGDAYLNVYTEVPQELTANTPDSHVFGSSTIDISADEGATIAVTYFNENTQQTDILGTAISTGGTTTINLSEIPNPGTEMLITITKQNYFRHTSTVTVIAPSGPYDVVDSFTINDGENNAADFGETFNLDISIKNVGVDLSENVEVTLTTEDTNVISLTNASNVSYGDIQPDSIETSNGSFTVELANNIPDETTISFDAVITDAATKSTYEGSLSFKVNAPVITIGTMIIDDAAGNGDAILDPGETADIVIPVTNIGHADVTNVIGNIASSSTNITINSATTSPVELTTEGTENLIFNVTADAATPDGTPVNIDFNVDAGAEGQYAATETKSLVIGFVPEYCDAGSDNQNDEHISRVQFVDIDNTSGASSYTDYTDMSTDVFVNESYPITITNGEHWSGDEMGCWVDWNYDGDFDDANENISINYSEPDGTGTITIPADVHIGMLTMRVRVKYSSGDLTPCGNTSYGEVEDYTINVISPNIYAGEASANPLEICSSGTTTLNITDWIGDSLQWQQSENGTTWTDITDATTESYTTTTFTENRYFRAEIYAEGENPVTTDVLFVEVFETPVAGTATSNTNEICGGESVELSLEGSTGSIQWQSSTDEANWTNINGAVTTPYTTTALTGDIYFRAQVSNGVCTAVNSNSSFVTVNESPDGGTVTAENTAICEGESTIISLAGHVGTIQWQKSTDQESWTDITDATSETYTTEALTMDTYYQAVLSTASCGSATSNNVMIDTYAPLTAGSVESNTSEICAGETVDLNLSGYSGNIQWQKSDDGSSWLNIYGATAETYTSNALSSDRYFRARVSNAGCGEVYSNELLITVNPLAETGAITSDETSVCEGSTITLNTSDYLGTMQWQVSDDNTEWTNLDGATADNYTSEVLTTSCFFRLMATNGCGDVYSEPLEISVFANPISAFTYETDSLDIILTNESENADGYTWDFGDGAGTSTATNPVYTYAAAGNYTVALSASNGICPDSQWSEEVNISGTGIDDLAKLGIEIFPNPTNGIFNVTVEAKATITIMNNTGKIVHQELINNTTTEVDIKSLPDGYYIIRFLTGDQMAYKKIIKQ